MKPLHSLMTVLVLQESVLALTRRRTAELVEIIGGDINLSGKARRSELKDRTAAAEPEPEVGPDPARNDAHLKHIGKRLVDHEFYEAPAHAAAELFARLHTRASEGSKTVTVGYVGSNLKEAKAKGVAPQAAPANYTKKRDGVPDIPADLGGLFKVSHRPANLFEAAPGPTPDGATTSKTKRVLNPFPPLPEFLDPIPENVVYVQGRLKSAALQATKALAGKMNTNVLADAAAAEVGVTAETAGAAEAGSAAIAAAEGAGAAAGAAEGAAGAAGAAEVAGVVAAEGALICLPCFAVVAAVAVVAIVATAAILGPIMINKAWDAKREAFTQDNVNIMMAMVDSNKGSAQWIDAVACYNKAYEVSDPNKVWGKVSKKLKMGLLHTDYDCMYLQSPVQFYTQSDGGFQNLAYSYHSDACTFDHETGDLTCRGRPGAPKC